MTAENHLNNWRKGVASFFKTDFGIFLVVALAWQFAMTILGWSLNQASPTAHMVQWDSNWYMHIINQGYGMNGNPAAPVFYPLFPLVISTLHVLSFGLISYEYAALILNTISIWFILVALYRVCRKLGASSPSSYLAVAAFLAFPSAFFLHVFYGEALFIMLAAWAYLFALRRQWWKVGALLALLTATRLPSLLVVGLCGLEYLRAHSWNLKKALNPSLYWFALAPLGFVLYGLYLLVVRQNFMAMFHAYDATSDWTYQVFNPNIIETLYLSVAKLFTEPVNYELFINTVLPLASLAAILISSFYILKQLKSKGVPLFIFGIVSVIFYTLNSNIISVHRYALAAIVIYIAISLYAKGKLRIGLVLLLITVMVAIQLFIFSRFANGVFGG